MGRPRCDARCWGLIPGDDFIDQRNAAPIIYLADEAEDASQHITNHLVKLQTLTMPAAPELVLCPAIVDQRYHVEIWAEKTTMNDVLDPIARAYKANLITGMGDLSATACKDFIKRLEQSGRQARILYISDFDPSGENMPVSVARKIEYTVRSQMLDDDIQVRSIALTKGQCEEFDLPRVPLKSDNKSNIARKERWEEKHGDGAVELDALEALRPGTLGRLVEAELERYFDPHLQAKTDDIEEQMDDQIDKINEAIKKEFKDDLVGLTAGWNEIISKINEWKGHAKRVYQGMDARLEEEAPDPDDIEWPEPADGDEDADPLYDSDRGYVEQIERYKRHQGKPIDGLSRQGEASRRARAAKHAAAAED